jgi:hypothetical protein
MIIMEIMLIVFFATVSFSFGTAYWLVFGKFKKASSLIVELLIKNQALEEIVSQIEKNPNLSNDAMHKENFIKFLSDSRDWAFKYIEEVQAGLTKFVTDIKPEINYFKEYGDITSMQPNYYSLKKITDAYDELNKLLPKEEEEIK